MRSAMSFVWVAMAAFLAPGLARANFIDYPSYTQPTLSYTNVDAVALTTPFPMFNPADGTLTEAIFSIDGPASWSANASGTQQLNLDWTAEAGSEPPISILSLSYFAQGPITVNSPGDVNTFSLDAFTGTGTVYLNLFGTLQSGDRLNFALDGTLEQTLYYVYTPNTTVPEPGSAGLLSAGLAALGLVGFAGFLRRRRA